MASMSEPPVDRLWKEYSAIFSDFDDLTLARWMAQTLGQLQGRAWRLSHPLLGAYRLAAQVGHDRQIWFKRLVAIPASYSEAGCCRSPLLPLFSRDVAESGLLCIHCNEVVAPIDELPPDAQAAAKSWAEEYANAHSIAHWDDKQRKSSNNYDQAFDDAGDRARRLLVQAGSELVPKFLDVYPAIVWEDQDECLEIRPEDVQS